MSLLDYPHLMTDEQRKQFLEIWEECKPKCKDIKFEVPIYYGKCKTS